MRHLIFFLLLLSACHRPRARGDVRRTIAIEAPSAAAATAQDAPDVQRHETVAVDTVCGASMLDGDGGVGLRAAADRGDNIRCNFPDGGTAWVVLHVTDRARMGYRLQTVAVQAEFRAMTYERKLRELATMDREVARGGDTVATEGLLFRAPERSVGRMVRAEGAVREVIERDGDTIMSILVDMVGRQQIEVTYPGLADDRIVSGLDVIVYGYCTGSHSVDRAAGPVVVPEVMAVAIVEQTGDPAARMLRRAQRR